MWCEPSSKPLSFRCLGSRRLPRRSLICALIAAFFATAGVGAQDLFRLSDAPALPGEAIAIPLQIRDRPSTPLGREGLAGIRGLSVTVEISPADAVEALTLVPGGVTTDLGKRIEAIFETPGRINWLVAYDEDVSLPDNVAGTVAYLGLQVAADLAPGTAISLSFVAATTALSNGEGTILETPANGALLLRDGTVTVESPPPPPPPTCTTDTTLCLLDDRFLLDVTWRDFSAQSGVGKAFQMTSDAGYFWFFDSDNVEVVVKILDGRGLNGHFWVFYGALTNVEFELGVTDSVTGERKVYRNPLGNFASVGDTEAFPGDGVRLPAERMAAGKTAAHRGVFFLDVPDDGGMKGGGGSCVPDETSLCLLGNRFRLEMDWEDFGGQAGAGNAIPLTSDSGFFWFFNPDNVELVVKTLDGRGLNGHFWVFYGALSNVEFTLRVTDTVTGEVREFFNSLGTFASVGDVEAF